MLKNIRKTIITTFFLAFGFVSFSAASYHHVETNKSRFDCGLCTDDGCSKDFVILFTCAAWCDMEEHKACWECGLDSIEMAKASKRSYSGTFGQFIRLYQKLSKQSREKVESIVSLAHEIVSGDRHLILTAENVRQDLSSVRKELQVIEHEDKKALAGVLGNPLQMIP